MIRAVIFDLDGTLVNSIPLHMKVEFVLMRHHGFQVTTDELRELNGTTSEYMFKTFVEKYKLAVTAEVLVQEKEALLASLFDSEPPAAMPGALTIIHECSDAGLKIAVASSSSRSYVMAVIRRLGIESMLNAVLTTEDAMHSKPDPDIFLKAAEMLEVEPSECVVVEDAKHGVTAAKRAGMRSVGYQSAPDMDLSEADLIIDDYRKTDINELLGE
jgi:HAD superfamily hydrolase (TIGR01509 family)